MLKGLKIGVTEVIHVKNSTPWKAKSMTYVCTYIQVYTDRNSQICTPDSVNILIICITDFIRGMCVLLHKEDISVGFTSINFFHISTLGAMSILLS